MKPLKGYKNVTKILIPPKCEHEGCPRDSDGPIAYISGESCYFYCKEHAAKMLNLTYDELCKLEE